MSLPEPFRTPVAWTADTLSQGPCPETIIHSFWLYRILPNRPASFVARVSRCASIDKWNDESETGDAPALAMLHDVLGRLSRHLPTRVVQVLGLPWPALRDLHPSGDSLADYADAGMVVRMDCADRAIEASLALHSGDVHCLPSATAQLPGLLRLEDYVWTPGSSRFPAVLAGSSDARAYLSGVLSTIEDDLFEREFAARRDHLARYGIRICRPGRSFGRENSA